MLIDVSKDMIQCLLDFFSGELWMKLAKVVFSSFCAVALSSALFAEGHGTHWGYTGHEAPQNWGTLAPEYAMCKDGKSQSPINITRDAVVATKGLEKIKFDYKAKSNSIVNNGHTIQVNFEEGSSITLDNKVFNLKQVHFHTPSENVIDGKSFPAEAHFVHASKDGELAVVALMFEEGKENKTVAKIWSKMPHKADATESFELSADFVNATLPKDKAYYRFNGSLTTPPCSEGVRWLVLKRYATMSKEQLKEFFDLMGHTNNRPVQPINARKVMN